MIELEALRYGAVAGDGTGEDLHSIFGKLDRNQQALALSLGELLSSEPAAVLAVIKTIFGGVSADRSAVAVGDIYLSGEFVAVRKD